MNKETITKLRETSKRTLKILDLLEQDATDRQIMDATGAERQLVAYYRKAIEKPRKDSLTNY